MYRFNVGDIVKFANTEWAKLLKLHNKKYIVVKVYRSINNKFDEISIKEYNKKDSTQLFTMWFAHRFELVRQARPTWEI